MRWQLPKSEEMSFKGWPTATPNQWKKFVGAHPDQEKSPPEKIKLSWLNWRLLTAIQREVNLHPYYPDVKGSDVWRIMEIPGDGGDCEDFVLTKRWLLDGAGVPPGALRPLVCENIQGIGHMVLCVCTDRGDFILDNIIRVISPWTRIPYKWTMRYEGEKWFPYG
jgi:predicted transglutaminase-like cysteine proteinase